MGTKAYQYISFKEITRETDDDDDIYIDSETNLLMQADVEVSRAHVWTGWIIDSESKVTNYPIQK